MTSSLRALPSLSALALALVVSGTATAQVRATIPAQRAADAGANSPDAAAGATVSSIEVVVMAGSHGAAGIAPALRAFTQLTRAPFTAFSQIEQVSRAQLALSEQTPATIAIPNNGMIRVSLSPTPRGRRVSVVVAITLGGRTHQSQYSVVAGDPFFLVHSTGVDSALIVRFVPRS